MKLRDWLRTSNVSIKSFAEQLQVERAMVYRYFTGAMPRASTIRRIELLTDGAVTPQDFYVNAMDHRCDHRKQPKKYEPSVSAQKALSRQRLVSVPRTIAWPDFSTQNIAKRGVQRDLRTSNVRPAAAVLVLQLRIGWIVDSLLLCGGEQGHVGCDMVGIWFGVGSGTDSAEGSACAGLPSL